MLTLILYLLAFFSGFAALVYQVAWSRMLALTFGSSILAVSAVVAGFMGGMGIGAWLYHRVGDRATSALKSYGILELSIGITTALFTLLFIPLPQWFAAVSHVLPAGPFMDLTRVVSVFALLLVPSALMGATYPALCQSMLRNASDVEIRLGWIYGLNTLGAALGAFVAGFVMIEAFGSQGSVHIANAINLSVGAIALLLARMQTGGSASATSAESSDYVVSSMPTWMAGTVLFGSGFATLGYEIVWFRALHYMMGPGTYVLSSALVIFLIGLGVGGTLYRPAMRFGKPEWNLGFAQLFIALLAIIAIGAEHWMLTNSAFNSEYSAFSNAFTEASWQYRVAIGFGISVAIMLPATLCMGIVFPLASRLFLGSAEHLTARLGLAYLLSNLGSIVGAIAAAIWILPSLGTVGGTKFLAAVNLLLGLLILHRLANGKLRLAATVLVAAVFALSMMLPARLAFQNLSESDVKNGIQLLFEEESDRGTVQVFQKKNNRWALSMSIDGASIGVTEAWNPILHAKQTLLAHLPMSLDRSIRHTLNLGVATSSTLKTLSKYDWVETLDAVEINPGVIRGTEKFLDSMVFHDPRVEIHIEDAVHYLLRTPKTYDLIISDAKQAPRFAGNSKILSAELYDYSLASMSECGLFVQFLSLGHSTEYYSLILRTFRETFDELELFIDPPSILFMVGSRCPIAGRTRPTVEELYETGVGIEISKKFLPQIDALPALWMASGHEISESIGEGPINSWDKLPLEFMSYRMESSNSDLEGWRENLERLVAPREAGITGPPEFTSLPHFDSLQAINRAFLKWYRGDKTEAKKDAMSIQARDPDNAFVRKALRFLR